MVIVLAAQPPYGKNVYEGAETQSILTAGQHIKVETSPQGAELLNAVVPVGKSWAVYVLVRVVETAV